MQILQSSVQYFFWVIYFTIMFFASLSVIQRLFSCFTKLFPEFGRFISEWLRWFELWKFHLLVYIVEDFVDFVEDNLLLKAQIESFFKHEIAEI